MPCSGLGQGGTGQWSRSRVFELRIGGFEVLVENGLRIGDLESAPKGKDKVGNWVRGT